MKILRIILLGTTVAILVGCASNGSDNNNVGVNKPYVPDVGATTNQAGSTPAGVSVYNPTNNIAEPSGSGSAAGNR